MALPLKTLALVIALAAFCVQGRRTSVLDYPVNTFIGTGGDGFGVGSTPPGVQLPFAMMRLSPDTAYDDIDLEWRHFGGYYYGDNEVVCFSHTHMVGAGVEDYGHIGVMATRDVKTSTVSGRGYRSKFSHEDETAYPGYYGVFLDTHTVLAELTVAGKYTGIHQYTYLGSGDNYVLIDPTHSVQKGAVVNASVSFEGSNASLSLSGWSLLKGSLTGRNGVGVKVFFVAKFLQTPISYGVWQDGQVFRWRRGTHGNNCGTFIEFERGTGPVIMALSISFISVQQARANMAHDWSGEGFSESLEKTQEVWRAALGQVEVESGNRETLTKFYTALYHSLCAPTQFSEAGGYYMGMDNSVHLVKSGTNYYSDLSLWDIHRTHTPLLTLLRPNVSRDIASSLLAMYEQGGALPRWPIANVFSGCMIGNHGYLVILDTYIKGVIQFDITTAYKAMKEEATNPNIPHASWGCLSDYISLGYCPKESAGNSVSLTLAYSFDDWALGRVAQLLNQTADAKVFLNRSMNYRNVWSTDKQLMCPRDKSGDFHCPLDPAFHEWMFTDSGYTEGDAAEWRWFVPHDVPGLIALFKSQTTFVEQLEEFFNRAKDHPSNLLPNPYYWAGNEPDLLSPYLFNFAARPDLTQKNVRWLLDNKYTADSSGLPGNDDYGTMSAWYVWGALGLYPLTGTDQYFIGSPAVDKATVSLSSGRSLVITAVNNTADNVYVQKVTLNGKEVPTSHPFLLHSDLVIGTNLTFWMSDHMP